MECIEARALKSSFLLKAANSQVFYNDDVWCLTAFNGGGAAAAADDFPVEDLLNLDFPEMEFQEEDEGSHNGNSSLPSSSSSSFSGTDEFDCLSAGELTIPVDDLENLEWLSRFVDDSMSELSLLCPAGSFPAYSVNRTQGAKTGIPSFPLPVCRKPRSKRSRPNGRPWPLASPPLSTADSSSTTSSSYGSTGLSPLVFVNPVHDFEFFSAIEKPPAKRYKRNPETDVGRRCTHCQVQRTPQWRTGPLGPKTLCNACGVRFKSGRLFPEYRPACSPSFSQEVHSNSHRKVLEMRRRKEQTDFDEPGSIWTVQTDG